MTIADERQIEKIMKNLKVSRAEAVAILEDDKEIDRGAKLFEQTAEQKKATKKYTNIGMKTTKKADSEKVKKVDEKKGKIFEKFIQFATESGCENVTIEKTDSELTFVYNDQKYRLKLTKARK